MKGRTFNTANLPVCLIDFNYTRDTNTAKFDSYFRHFGESVIFVFRQTKSKFAHGEWRSLSANPVLGLAQATDKHKPGSAVKRNHIVRKGKLNKSTSHRNGGVFPASWLERWRRLGRDEDGSSTVFCKICRANPTIADMMAM